MEPKDHASFDFNQEIDQEGYNATKFVKCESIYGRKDIIPLFIADADYDGPAPIFEECQKRLSHRIFGYTVSYSPEYAHAFEGWYKRIHGWDVSFESYVYAPAVFHHVCFAIEEFSAPGDGVIVQTPVYPYFFNVTRTCGRTVLENRLLYNTERNAYEVDFADFERKAAEPRARMFLLCSPHNPVGRVWSREELHRMGEICRKHNIIVVSDEIHMDLAFQGHKHIPFPLAGEGFQTFSIVLHGIGKTFNVPSMYMNHAIIPDKGLRKRYANRVMVLHQFEKPPALGGIALTAALGGACDAWYRAMMDHIEDNYNLLVAFTRESLPGTKVVNTDGTYLIWLNMRAYLRDTGDAEAMLTSHKELDSILVNKARVGLQTGTNFGGDSYGFQRICIATPRPRLVMVLNRMYYALLESGFIPANEGRNNALSRDEAFAKA